MLLFDSHVATVAFNLVLSLGFLLLTSLSDYQKVVRIMGKPWIAALVGAGALFALVNHISEHFGDYVLQTYGSFTISTGLLGAIPFVIIAGFGFWVDRLYHSHEGEHTHAEHSPDEAGSAATFSSIVRLGLLAFHAFLDGDVMASLGLGWRTIPFIFHKGVDGLVINGERNSQTKTTRWRWRIAIQLIATTTGSFFVLDSFPEYIHIGLVAAVIGLYSSTLFEFVAERRTQTLQTDLV